jgi:hypothetical protein
VDKSPSEQERGKKLYKFLIIEGKHYIIRTQQINPKPKETPERGASRKHKKGTISVLSLGDYQQNKYKKTILLAKSQAQ